MTKYFSPFFTFFLLLIVPLFAISTISCGKNDDGSGENVRSPFAQFGKATVFLYEMKPVGENPTKLTVRYIGETTFNGKTVEHYQGTYLVSAGTKTVDVYGQSDSSKGFVEVAGFSVTYPSGSGKTDYVVTFDKPVFLEEASIPIGVEQTLTVSGSVKIGNNDPVKGNGEIRFTKTAEDATVETDFGVVSGVHVFEGEGRLDDMGGTGLWDIILGKTVRLEAWYHPTFGVLEVVAPDLGLGAKLLGENDCGNPQGSDYNTIQKIGVVSKETPEFILSNYDCSGEFDADKMRHAKMYLELRWADESKAKTQDLPQVEVLFGTVWGYFPFQLVQSPVSIFHPEENKEGFAYWYAYVDEAAKNEPGENGILYQIKVTFPDYMTSPVRVTARIHYPIYRP